MKTIVRKNEYHDSVLLMDISHQLNEINGVKKVVVLMGTDMNKSILEELGMLTSEARKAGPGDLIISIETEKNVLTDDILETVDIYLTQKRGKIQNEIRFPSLEVAIESSTEANIVGISLPGQFVASEARKAIEKGLHLFIFSDNVPIDQEIELKRLGEDKGVMVMGPECGTAVINGISLGLMSKVKPGEVGLVGASGSGIQEVAVLLDRIGIGISQALGTGGRDIQEEVGGLSILKGMELLKDDVETKLVILISKIPAPGVRKKINRALKDYPKPILTCFLGEKNQEQNEAFTVATLDEAAFFAGRLLKGQGVLPRGLMNLYGEELKIKAKALQKRLRPEQKYIRGLFGGGTHCEEAAFILKDFGTELHSNMSGNKYITLKDTGKSFKNTLIDLGAEEFTRDRPHPVIEPSIIKERFLQEGLDKEVGVLLFDIILGFGAHNNPIGELEETLREISDSEKKGGGPVIIASICGTTGDPQNLEMQRKRMEENGVIVMPSNAQAALLAALIKFFER